MQKRTTHPALIVSISIALFFCLSARLGECVDPSLAAGWKRAVRLIPIILISVLSCAKDPLKKVHACWRCWGCLSNVICREVVVKAITNAHARKEDKWRMEKA